MNVYISAELNEYMCVFFLFFLRNHDFFFSLYHIIQFPYTPWQLQKCPLGAVNRESIYQLNKLNPTLTRSLTLWERRLAKAE